MSAVNTKKPDGDLAQQLQFPTVFEYSVKPTYGYISDPISGTLPIAGDDLQAQYHQQKNAEAVRSVMNGLHNNKMADYRFTHAAHGYFGMPKAVLSQRIYANPS